MTKAEKKGRGGKKQKSRAELTHRAQRRRDTRHAYLFLLPWLIGFVVFTGFPLLYTFILSFNDVKLDVRGWEIHWNGISNYQTAILKNVEFIPALTTFIGMAVVYVPAIIVVSIILALLLNTKIKGRSVFRMIYFLPVIILSGSAMKQLMQSGVTMIGVLKDYAFIEFLESFFPDVSIIMTSLLTNFTMVLWFTGVPIVLLINGLQKIDREQYEAVSIDGADAWQTLWKITMPQLREVILVSTIFAIVQVASFSINPVNDIISTAIYNSAAGFGLASAYATIYSVAMLLIIGLAFLILYRKEKVPTYQKLYIKR